MGAEVHHVGSSHLRHAVESITFIIGCLEGRLMKPVLNHYKASFPLSLMFTMSYLASRNT
jgi:hypothetical protein